jgi:hypothetical protein
MPNNENSSVHEGSDVKKVLAELDGPFPPDQVRWRVMNTSNDKKRGQIVPYADPQRLHRPAERALLTAGLDARLPGRNHEQHHSREQRRGHHHRQSAGHLYSDHYRPWVAFRHRRGVGWAWRNWRVRTLPTQRKRGAPDHEEDVRQAGLPHSFKGPRMASISAIRAENNTLFEIDAELEAQFDAATKEQNQTGAIGEEAKRRCLDLFAELSKKVDRIARYLRATEFRARAAKEEVARLTARQKTAESRLAQLKSMLAYYMLSRGLRRLEGELNTIRLQKNGQAALEIDASAVPQSYYVRTSL